MAFALLQFVALSAVDFSAGVLIELESRTALMSDAFVVDHLEVFRTLSELASSLRSEGVALLADLMASSLEVFVSSRAGFSDALVTNSLEACLLVAGNQHAFIVFKFVTVVALGLGADTVLSLVANRAFGSDTELSNSYETSFAWNNFSSSGCGHISDVDDFGGGLDLSLDASLAGSITAGR